MGEKNMAKNKGSKGKTSVCKCQLKGAVKDKQCNVVFKSAGHVKGSSSLVSHQADGRTVRITKVANKIINKYDKAFCELSKK